MVSRKAPGFSLVSYLEGCYLAIIFLVIDCLLSVSRYEESTTLWLPKVRSLFLMSFQEIFLLSVGMGKEKFVRKGFDC